MNPLLEINPPECILVVGPKIAACYATKDGKCPPSGYRAAIEAGILSAREIVPFASEEAKQHHHQLLRETCELDPALAAHKLVEILKQHECFDEWLQKTFAAELCREASSKQPNATVEHLLELQKHGALLACTQYDTLLDAVAGTEPVVLEDSVAFQKWASGEAQGFLHLHGVYSRPHTVKLDGTTYKKSLAESCSTSFSAMAELFKLRLVIFIGFDTKDFDPLVPHLLQAIYPDDSIARNTPILLTTNPSKSLPGFLQLGISQEEVHQLRDVISVGSEKNFSIGKSLEKSPDKLKVQALLLFDDKQSFRRLGDIIYQQSKSGEIYVRRDALTIMFGEKILYGNLVTYGGNGLRQLWDLVFTEDSPLHKKGLIALGMQNAAIVWTRRKPSGLGNVTGINSVHTYATSKSIPSASITVADNPGSVPGSTLSTSSNPYSGTVSLSNGSLSSPMKSPTSLRLYPAATVALSQPTHIVSPPVLVGGSRLISPTAAALLTPATVSQNKSGVVPQQLQMIIQPLVQGPTHGHASSLQQTSAAEVGFLPGSVSGADVSERYRYGIARPPERLGSSSSGPGRFRYGIAAAPEPLSSIPTHLYDFHDKADIEHTIVYIDQLTAVPHVWPLYGTRVQENRESLSNSDQESGSSSLRKGVSREGTRSRTRKKSASLNNQAPKQKTRSVSLNLSPASLRQRPSAFQRVDKEHSSFSGSKPTPTSSIGTPTAKEQAAPITVMQQTVPTAVSVLPGGQSVLLSPQNLVAPRATTVPLLYSPAAQQVGYCMLVNAQQPVVVANQSISSYPLQTGQMQPTFYVIPGGSQAPALVQQMPAHVTTNSKLPGCISEAPIRNCKRSPSPQSSAPPAKRRKRSSSLPNIMRPSSTLQEQKIGKDATRVEDRNPSESNKNSQLPLPSLKASFSDIEKSHTQNQNESDTETASSESDDVKTMAPPPPVPACTNSASGGSLPFVQFKSHIHLWEFLLELLLSPNHGSIIQWTGNGYEFRIVNPAMVAQLWGARKSKPLMTYEKLSRALRYYYTRGIMDRVPGRRLTFKFSFDIQKYITGTNRIKFQ